MIKNNTIAAIATPPGIGALAIIRISGFHAFNNVAKIIIQKDKFLNAPIRFVRQYHIKNLQNNEIIDEVTAIKYKAPNTYTGENLVEIISHGGYFTVRNIMNQLIGSDIEIAEKGEFSKRAFINGKIDLVKAESIKMLIETNNENEHLNAVNLYAGFSKKLIEWRELLQQELSYCEAEIEFSEEDSVQSQMNTNILKIKNIIQEDLQRIQKFKEIRNGINVVIAGPTNAGKSSLFNYLLGHNRAIVHEQHGTTRDSIYGKIEVDGKHVNLYDTAGIRLTDDLIEKEGIKISKELINNAHVVLWVSDISDEIDENEIKLVNSLKEEEIILILNKNDRHINSSKKDILTKMLKNNISVSINSKINTTQMIRLIREKIVDVHLKTPAPDIFLNERHEKIARKLNNSLNKVLHNWNQKEITAYYLKECLTNFEEMSGKIDNEKIINKIFSTFCIGK